MLYHLQEKVSKSNSNEMQSKIIIPSVHTSPLSESLPNASASGGKKIKSEPYNLN